MTGKKDEQEPSRERVEHTFAMLSGLSRTSSLASHSGPFCARDLSTKIPPSMIDYDEPLDDMRE